MYMNQDSLLTKARIDELLKEFDNFKGKPRIFMSKGTHRRIAKRI